MCEVWNLVNVIFVSVKGKMSNAVFSVVTREFTYLVITLYIMVKSKSNILMKSNIKVKEKSI